MRSLTLLICAYGLLIGLGGLIGFFMAGSVPSLIAGSTFSFLLLTSGYLMQNNRRLGLMSSTVLTLILAGFFSYRYLATEKFMPSGMMAFLSAAVFLIIITNVSLKKCEE